MIKLIKLSKYMQCVDVDAIVPLNTPIDILGKSHVIHKWHNKFTYTVVVEGIIIPEIITCDRDLTYGMLYNALKIKSGNNTLSIGDILYNKNLNEYSIISKVDGFSFNIINLDSGNRWSDAKRVRDIFAITYAEISEYLSKDINKFYYIGNGADVIEVKKC